MDARRFPCLNFSPASESDFLIERYRNSLGMTFLGGHVAPWKYQCVPGQPAYVPQNPQVLNASAAWQGCRMSSPCVK